MKVIETKKAKGKREITRLASVKLSSEKDEDISQEIRKLFKSQKIVSAKVRLNLPRHLATIRFLRLPSTNDEEIKKMLKTESLKYLPYAEEEIAYGHRILSKGDDGYSNVLLAIAQVTTLDRLLRLLKGADLSADSISIGSEGLFLWYLLKAPDEGVPKAVILVNIDSDYIDIGIINDSTLVFTRGIPCDNVNLFNRMQVLDEVRVSIAAYQKESAEIVGKIILTGIRDKVNTCEDLFKKAMRIPIEARDQTQDTGVACEAAGLDSESPSFAELIGSALSFEKLKVDLLPSNISEEIRLRSLKNGLVVTLTLTALIGALALAGVIKHLADKRVYLAYINKELTRIEPRVNRAKKMMDDINIVKEELEKRPLAIDILSEVYKLTPNGISLNMLDFERMKALVLRGRAGALSEIFKYIGLLEGSSYFENVRVKYATKRVVANREAVDFEISCSLSKQ
ncbi:MAG: hypothetical protein A2987_02235 [Omnitrophica bacterium RIFCSPLOWO2_01_FULL_45_10]|nr:MAG: hypothetical protein A2987_02235 [Omnitrophica bacterium RIFCSPLOWO2_01_FULL_45_10]